MQEVRGSNPLSSTKSPAAMAGDCAVSEVERHPLGSVPSPRRVRERSGPGGFEGVGGPSVSAFEQVSVDVVGGADRGVPESLGDDVGVFSGGDEESDVGVAEVAGPHRLTDRFPYCGI